MPIINVFNLTILLTLAFFGLLIFVLGAFIIFWSIYLLIQEVFIHGNKFIEKGPFKFVRHPIYLSWIIGTFGLALFANSLLGLIYSFILSLILSRIADYEEEDTRTRIGDEYVDYIKKVPKLFPFGI